MFGISIWQLAIILVIVILIFGTKKLRNMGGDLGGALKNFKDAVGDGKDSKGENAADSERLNQQTTKAESSDAEFSDDKDKHGS